MREQESLITTILERIQQETGIVLSRQSDRDRIGRYLDGGGVPPSVVDPLPADLIKLITTNETYFERESHHFQTLMETILPELDQSAYGPIRILCAPCSSGEEVYTIALRIASATKRFSRPVEITGIDISSEMIEKARNRFYSARSVHALDQSVLDRYFTQEAGGYRLLALSAPKIKFIEGNVFDPGIWEKLGRFEVIFSRNMMIYFDAPKNRELLKRFHDHLSGYLILGHADDHVQAREFFTPLRSAKGLIYRT